MQELDESTYWMELLIDCEFAPPANLRPLLQEARELLSIFTSIVKSKKANR